MQKKIVLVGGCFDVLHIGHVHFLKKAKSFGDFLVVLLESDENIKRLKGEGRPIHNLTERSEVLASIKYVDRIVCLPKRVSDETYLKIIKKIKPNVIAITQGDRLEDHKRKQAEIVGATLKIIKKYKNISSSTIINIL